MPFYEYRCENCGHEMESLQKINDSPLVDCPRCARPTLKKLVSAAGFRLKGSGWYETDFKGGKKKNVHDAGEKPEAAEKKSGGSAPDTGKGKTGGEKKTEAAPKPSSAG